MEAIERKMKFLLVGVQNRYISQLRTGFTRESAAFFMIPVGNSEEKSLLIETLAVAVFHAIGLHMLYSVAQSGETVLTSVYAKKPDNGISIAVFGPGIVSDGTDYQYKTETGHTYPYRKVSECGPIHIPLHGFVQIPPKLLQYRITATKDNNCERFFKKQKGKPFLMHGCSSKAIREMCYFAANAVVDTVMALLFESNGGLLNDFRD